MAFLDADACTLTLHAVRLLGFADVRKGGQSL
jgi:hypothetical protein